MMYSSFYNYQCPSLRNMGLHIQSQVFPPQRFIALVSSNEPLFGDWKNSELSIYSNFLLLLVSFSQELSFSPCYSCPYVAKAKAHVLELELSTSLVVVHSFNDYSLFSKEMKKEKSFKHSLLIIILQSKLCSRLCVLL